MKLLLIWSVITVAMGILGSTLHKHGIGPLHAVRRGAVYLTALISVITLSWQAAQSEFNRQWPECVYRAWREW